MNRCSRWSLTLGRKSGQYCKCSQKRQIRDRNFLAAVQDLVTSSHLTSYHNVPLGSLRHPHWGTVVFGRFHHYTAVEVWSTPEAMETTRGDFQAWHNSPPPSTIDLGRGSSQEELLFLLLRAAFLFPDHMSLANLFKISVVVCTISHIFIDSY